MDEIFRYLKECIGFAWDSGNCNKSAIKHGVSCTESEEVFFNHPLFLLKDSGHSRFEQRIHAFGKTTAGRPLALTFAIREQQIRIISARDQNRKELKTYGFQR